MFPILKAVVFMSELNKFNCYTQVISCCLMLIEIFFCNLCLMCVYACIKLSRSCIVSGNCFSNKDGNKLLASYFN